MLLQLIWKMWLFCNVHTNLISCKTLIIDKIRLMTPGVFKAMQPVEMMQMIVYYNHVDNVKFSVKF